MLQSRNSRCMHPESIQAMQIDQERKIILKINLKKMNTPNRYEIKLIIYSK